MSQKLVFHDTPIESLPNFIDHVWSGFWIIIDKKPYHPQFALNLPIRFVIEKIEEGAVFYAVDSTGEHYYYTGDRDSKEVEEVAL